MALWHLGGAVFLFRWIFRDRKVDLRFLALGAVLPDVIDLPIGTLALVGRYSTGELAAHSLLFAAVLGVGVLAATRRGRVRRRWMAMTIGVLLHLLLDGMWTSTEVFFWPLAGLDFPRLPSPYWSGAWERALADPWRWAKEAVGLVYLVALARRSGLNDAARRRTLITEGRLA